MPSQTHDMDDPSSAADAESANSHAPSSPTHVAGDKNTFRPLTLTGKERGKSGEGGNEVCVRGEKGLEEKGEGWRRTEGRD